MLKKYSLKALQLAINQALRLDPDMPERINTLDGKIIEIIVAPLDVNFYIHFNQAAVHLLDKTDSKPDTTIHSSPIGLIRLSLLPASKARSLFNDNIRITGDVVLGQKVKKIFDEMDIDWEGHLAEFTGDVVAHQLGSLFRKGVAFTRKFNASMLQNATEYIQEELRASPSREELNDFYNDIDTLALDIERASARINQLMIKNEIN